MLMGLVSLIEPTSIVEALLDTGWILAMQEELSHSLEMMYGILCQDLKKPMILELNGSSKTN